jgi:hypothetical protein
MPKRQIDLHALRANPANPRALPLRETLVAGHQRRLATQQHARATPPDLVEQLLADVPMQAIIDERMVEAVLEDTDAAEAAAALPAIPVGIISTEQRSPRLPRSVRAGKRRLKKKKRR